MLCVANRRGIGRFASQVVIERNGKAKNSPDRLPAERDPGHGKIFQ